MLILPNQLFINGQSSIPPPSAKEFDKNFGGFLPERHILNSAIGETAYYLYTSNPSAPPSNPPRRAILLHGGSTPCINFIPLVENILDVSSSSPHKTEIMIYDYWGHGLSSTPLQPHTPSLFTQQLLHVLNHLKWQNAHLMGYSASCSIAISAAAYHPEALASVTLIGPVGLLHSSDISYYDRTVRSGGPFGLWEGAAVRNMLRLADGGPPPVISAETAAKMKRGEPVYDMEAVQAWQRVSHPGHLASMASIVRNGGVYDMHKVWGMVAEMDVVPSMVILGEHDATFKAEVIKKELKILGWKGDVCVVEDVGHLVPRQKPRETAELLVRFWDKVEGK